MIWSRNNRHDPSKEITTDSLIELQRLDEVMCKGYKVLKEVKKQKIRVETDWNFTGCQFEFDDHMECFGAKKKIPVCEKSTKSVTRTKEANNKQENLVQGGQLFGSTNYLPLGSYPSRLDQRLLYQYFTTGHIPIADVAPVDHSQTSNIIHSVPADVIPVQNANIISEPVVPKDVAVHIDGKRVANRPQLIVEVLPSINIDQDLDTINSTLLDQSDTDTKVLTETSKIEISDEKSQTNSCCDMSLSPTKTSPSPVIIPQSTCSCLRCRYNCCVTLHQRPEASSYIGENMKNSVYKQAEEWVQRELMARAISTRVTHTQPSIIKSPPEEGGTETVVDSEVGNLVKEVLYEQALLLLSEEKNTNLTPDRVLTFKQNSSDNIPLEDKSSSEYTFSGFESCTEHEESVHSLILTPQSTPSLPNSLEEVKNEPLIPTPQLSPMVPVLMVKCDGDDAGVTLIETISTPDLTLQATNSVSLLTTPSSSSKEEEKSTSSLKPSVEHKSICYTHNDSLSTSYTGHSSTQPASLSLTSSDDNEISYGENIISCPLNGRGVSISEGEVLLSPGDIRWKTKIPFDLEKDHDAPLRKSFHCDDRHEAISIGEVKKSDVIRTNKIWSCDLAKHSKIPETNTDELFDQDTLADVPSFTNELSSMTSYFSNETTKGHLGHDGSLSPGEVPHMSNSGDRTISVTNSSVSQSLSMTDSTVTLPAKNTSKSDQFLSNRLRNGIDVINISHRKNQTDVSAISCSQTNDSIKSNSQKKILVSSDEPKGHSFNHWIEKDSFKAVSITTDQRPVVLIDKIDTESTSNYSFTFSSVSPH